MNIVRIDVLDGRGSIDVAVVDLIDAQRLRAFVSDAAKAMNATQAKDEHIDTLRGALREIDARLKKCAAIPASAHEAYDTYYRGIVEEALDQTSTEGEAP